MEQKKQSATGRERKQIEQRDGLVLLPGAVLQSGAGKVPVNGSDAGLAAGAAVEGAIMGTVDSISQEITPIVNDIMDLPSGESLLGF